MSVCSIERESDRNGGCQIPSMRSIISIRERSNDFFHSTRWRVRIDELSVEHSSEAVDLGRGYD